MEQMKTDKTLADGQWVLMPRRLTHEMVRRAQEVLAAATMTKKEGLIAEYAAMVDARPPVPTSVASQPAEAGRVENALVAVLELMAPLSDDVSVPLEGQMQIRRIVGALLRPSEDAPFEDEFPELFARHKFAGDPSTRELVSRLESGSDGSLHTEAADALRAMSERIVELEEKLKFVAEGGEHFIVMSSSEDHDVLSEKYQRLLKRHRQLTGLDGDGRSLHETGSRPLEAA